MEYRVEVDERTWSPLASAILQEIDATPPTLLGPIITNDGEQQRSHINSISYMFSENVRGAAALSSVRLFRNGAEDIPLLTPPCFILYDQASFRATIESSGLALEDGEYELRIIPSESGYGFCADGGRTGLNFYPGLLPEPHAPQRPEDPGEWNLAHDIMQVSNLGGGMWLLGSLGHLEGGGAYWSYYPDLNNPSKARRCR